ncbi:hypothetical protein ACLOJK_007370 [Asimina triloba]
MARASHMNGMNYKDNSSFRKNEKKRTHVTHYAPRGNVNKRRLPLAPHRRNNPKTSVSSSTCNNAGAQYMVGEKELTTIRSDTRCPRLEPEQRADVSLLFEKPKLVAMYSNQKAAKTILCAHRIGDGCSSPENLCSFTPHIQPPQFQGPCVSVHRTRCGMSFS